MARANLELIVALRRTAARLSGDVSYQWGHMGMCNCGHLAQSITGLAGPEIHQSALIREGDWEQQALAAMFESECHSERSEEPVWRGGTMIDVCVPPSHTVPSPSLRSGSG